MAGSIKNIHNHASFVDKKKRVVICKYCAENTRSLNQLKIHLSGVVNKPGYPCEEVTDIVVRETYRNELMKDKRGRKKKNSSSKSVSAENGNIDVVPCEQVIRERFRDRSGLTDAKRVGEVQTGNSHKRARSEEDSSGNSVSACNGNIDVEVEKRARSEESSNESERSEESSKESVSAENGNIDVEDDKCARSKDSTSKIASAVNGDITVVADEQDLLSNQAQKCIARFFYENCIDFSAVDSPSFKEMMTAGGGQLLKFPDSHELNGRMLQETLKEVKEHVKKIKDSWEITGCSILLDAWVDEKGQDLVTFVADSPAGPVYVGSFDVSDIKDDVTALKSLVDGVLEEVGVHNVVQIIACSTWGWVGELGKSFVGDNKRNVFWSVSMSYCIELMLIKIREMDNFGEVLDKVSNIWEFIKNNPSALNIFRDHSHGMIATVSYSEYEVVTSYLTLETVFKAKSDLEAMFALSDWSKEISKLLKDSSFWETVERFAKSTSPLIHGLVRFSTANNQNVGNIYDTVVGIKKSIAKQFNGEKVRYKPLWDVIDDVWKKHLHSPLHAAGYFLNPAFFHSTDFHIDRQVATGLISSLVHIVKESHVQNKIASQLGMYGQGIDCEASEADQIGGISPGEWWSQKANQHQELQSFAIKVLSQTCEGASRYKLKRSLAEKLLFTEGMSQKHVEDLAFVHYNLHLQSFKAKNVLQ